MERHILLHCRRGFSLLEILAVVVILGVILSCVIPIGVERVNRTNYEKTIREMTSIAQACTDYYNSNSNTWPSSTSPWVPTGVLVPQYIYHLVSVSPWGTNYEVSFKNNLVTVSTTIPPGIAEQNKEGSLFYIVHDSNSDEISITQTVPVQFTARLLYDQKH